MSAPARSIVSPEPVRPAPSPPRRRTAQPHRRAAHPRTTATPQRRRRVRRAPHPVFMVFSAVIVTALVVGAVSLSAMLVQTSFRADALGERLTELADRSEVLDIEVAELSSPFRVAEWARTRGMVMPDDVVILTVPGEPGR